MLTKEQLLQTRYKCIADYPKATYRKGNIILIYENSLMGENYSMDADGTYLDKESFFQQYPHLFQKLEWWEERETKEYPKFVKDTRGGGLMTKKETYRVSYFENDVMTIIVQPYNTVHNVTFRGFHINRFIPSTEKEIISFINAEAKKINEKAD